MVNIVALNSWYQFRRIMVFIWKQIKQGLSKPNKKAFGKLQALSEHP